MQLTEETKICDDVLKRNMDSGDIIYNILKMARAKGGSNEEDFSSKIETSPHQSPRLTFYYLGPSSKKITWLIRVDLSIRTNPLF